ncbi:unnamed protein product, partial [marine sediment metagenome]
MIILEDWENRLCNYLVSVRYARFRWGRHDCCTFGADVNRAVTGRIVTLPGYKTIVQAEDTLA